jgi:hypothetical protein
MALPTAYLTSAKNVEGILMAIRNAQAPSKFTQSFLASLGYASSSDRLIINVLKAIGFLTPSGEPTERYIRYLDPAQSAGVLTDGIREAYADLFQINTAANTMTRAELKGKLKVLAGGKISDAVADKMSATFLALCKAADWSTQQAPPPPPPPSDENDTGDEGQDDDGTGPDGATGLSLGGLVYNIQIQLPESRDQAVYDALFKSLKAHLIQ